MHIHYTIMRHVSIQRLIIQIHHLFRMLKNFIIIKKNHQSINFNSLNNMIIDVNAKISSSQIHAKIFKIVFRKEVL